MRRVIAFLALGGCLVGQSIAADPGVDTTAWLNRITTAAQNLNYVGTFIYQSGNHSETSRIIHVVDDSGEREKLEVLDGSPREIIRNNDEVLCYLPEDKVVIIERRSDRKTFPALLPATVVSLTDNYHIRKAGTDRVAGLESQVIVLEPKDKFRYGHVLWADLTTGLLLKARMVDERNQPLEQFAFTQVQIGGQIDKSALKPKFAARPADWRVQDVQATERDLNADDWLFRNQVPGFRKSAEMIRRGVKDGEPMNHVVFSDGMAAISVFIEPAIAGRADPRESGVFSVGGINVYKRLAGDYSLTLLGEVPPVTLRRLGDGIEHRKK